MTDLITQILATLGLVLGIAGGETAATRAFGIFKKKWLYIVEISFFVICIVIVFNTLMIVQMESYWLIFLYFLSGFLIIIFIRAAMTGAGIFAEQIMENVIKPRKEEDYILGLKKALERRGFKVKEIRRMAREIGYSEEKIGNVFDFWAEEKPKKKAKKRRKKFKWLKK
jgi:hypothetical protein